MTENTNFYFTIHSFMTRELGLRGAALTIYAIIYSFSGNGIGTFYGSREMLADMAGVSVSTVGKILKELIDSSFISVVEGKNYEHKEYRAKTDILQNGKRKSPATQPKSTCIATENHLLGSQNSPAAQPKSTCNNKHNNKNNNKSIFNSYKGAEAPEREKEKNIFKEDFFEGEGKAYSPDGNKTEIKAEENPIYIKERTALSENVITDAKGDVAKEKSSSAPSRPGNRYSQSEHQRNFRGGQSRSVPGFPAGKYIHFDPDEAFRLALERTEEWMAEINAKSEARDTASKT